jgi:c-di-GMP-binding flagellar brake protein YcgR
MIMESHDFILEPQELVGICPRGADAGTESCSSRILSIRESGYEILCSEECEQRMHLKEGDDLFITFLRNENAYGFGATVVGKSQASPPVLSVRITGPAQKVQRRAYVRVAAALEVELKSSGDSGGTAPIVSSPAYRSVTLDISGNGFAIPAERPWDPGSLFDVKLWLPRQTIPLNFQARVARCSPLQPGAAGRSYVVGFSILMASELVNRRLRRFIIRFQQESLHCSWLQDERPES